MTDFEKLAELARDWASQLEQHGREALRNAKDWQSPLKSPEGAASSGSVSRPTETVAVARAEGHTDGLHLHKQLLLHEWRVIESNIVDNLHRIRLLVGTALPENTRAGIGACVTCGRYCDGTRNNRLVNGECAACRQRHQRNTRRAS